MLDIPVTLSHFQDRIKAKIADCHSGGSMIIVAFGDSVTMGATISGESIPGDVYHQRVKKMLECKYPTVQFSIINSGIGGDGIDQGHARLERDVIRYQPDLVLVAFGINNAGDMNGSADFEQKLAGLVDQIRARTCADIILLTPNFMNTRAETSGPMLPAHMGVSFSELSARLSHYQNEGKVAQIAQAIRNVGNKYHIPVADVYHRWKELSQSGADIMTLLANRLNHPTVSAHQIAADEIIKYL